jgi:hypothetical protein
MCERRLVLAFFHLLASNLEIKAVQPHPFKSERQAVTVTFVRVYLRAHKSDRMLKPI